MVWLKEKNKTRWWNRKTNKPTLVVDVWRYAPKKYRASVNNSWLAKDVSKTEAIKEAKNYMKRIS